MRVREVEQGEREPKKEPTVEGVGVRRGEIWERLRTINLAPHRSYLKNHMAIKIAQNPLFLPSLAFSP